LSFSPNFHPKKRQFPKKSRWRSSCANYLFFERNNLNFERFRDGQVSPTDSKGQQGLQIFFLNRSKEGIKLRRISRMVPVLPFSEMSNCHIADLSRAFVVHVYRPGNSKDEVVRKK